MAFPWDRGPMRRDRFMPLTGYFDRLAARSGQQLALKVSCAKPGRVSAKMVQLRYGDANPIGPGLLADPVSGMEWEFVGEFQPIDLGSYAVLPEVSVPSGDWTFAVNVQPWLLRDAPAVIAASRNWELQVDPDGLRLCVGNQSTSLPTMLKRKHWYRIWVSFRASVGEVTLGCASLTGPERPYEPRSDVVKTAALGGLSICGSPTSLAARVTDGLSDAHFNGRLEAPVLLPDWFATPPPPADEALALIAWWDFSQGIDTQALIEMGPSAAHGRLVNVPMRAVRGSNWSSTFVKWTDAPEEYGAIHFHEDDLYDCCWDTSLTVTIPEGLRSGIYAIHLRCAEGEDTIPFYILPESGSSARICFLASTFTYQAYANFARGNLDDALRARMEAWGAPRHNPDDYDIYGFSHYNHHPDGSGHHFSSRLRPIMTMRPGFLTFNDPKGSGIRHFPADMHLTRWLELNGFEYDVVTDEALDDEGVDLISKYDIVLTGSHPEYHTDGTLDALEAFQALGGNFCYLGGNGFYWRVERSPSLPGMLELRRAETGIRAWGTDAGENFHQLRPVYGGLWRRSGRPPQKLCGVGFSAQGLFTGSYYRIDPAARASAAGWILEGVDEAKLGDYGLNGGGAAGFELDRADVELGTPDDAIVLASSEGHDDSFDPVIEDILGRGKSATGTDYYRLIRSDIVWLQRPSGAQVFSVGSIFFCGSLLVNDGNNGISRMLKNVIERFLKD